MPEGKYRISSSSLGYKDTVQMISVAGGKALDMPAWVMEDDAQQIDAVSVTTQAVRTTINGDTIVYNASAYKVMPDADTDELLAKMPGITVNGGSVGHQDPARRGGEVGGGVRQAERSGRILGHRRRQQLQGDQHRHPQQD